jgi:hypothetical protein
LKDVAKQIREKEKENKNSTPSRPTLNKIVVRATIGGAYYCSLSGWVTTLGITDIGLKPVLIHTEVDTRTSIHGFWQSITKRYPNP